jgi:hypothetical protein
MSNINVSVLNSLCDYVNSLSYAKTTPLLNDDVCRMIATNISHIDGVFRKYYTKSTDCSGQKTVSKKDKIRADIIKKQLESDTELLIAQDNIVYRNWKFNESKVFSVILWCIKMCKDICNYESYDAIMSLSAIINEYQLFDEKNESVVGKVISEIYYRLQAKLKIAELFSKYSELIISNFYTTNYSSNTIQPYKSQKQVIDLYKKSLSDDLPLCINYSTETGSGKTYLSLAIAKAHHQHSSSNKSATDDAFIFVCYNITVRKMVLDMCNKLNIPACLVEINSKNYAGDIGPCFNLNRCAINIKIKKSDAGNNRARGIGGGINHVKEEWAKFDALLKSGNDETKIRNQFIYLNSIKDRTQSFNANLPQVYICDVESAEHFVKIAPNSTVFIDEPDVDDREIAAHYTNIFAVYPKRVIISSATIGDMTDYVRKFKLTHESAIIDTVNQGTSGIHSTMIVKDKIVMPHMFIDFSDKKKFMQKIESHIKLYSPLAIAKLVEYYNSHNGDMLALDACIGFVDVNYDSIRKFVMRFFNELYENIAHINTGTNIMAGYSCDEIKYPFTTDNHLIAGQTLSISNNPFQQAKSWECDLFIVDKTLYDIKEARKTYLCDLKNYKQGMAKIKSNVSTKDSRQILDHKIAEFSKTQPTMIFPSEAIIGSAAHRSKYGGSVTRYVRSKFCGVNEMLFECADYELIKWMYSGVGFYDHDLPKQYVTDVLNSAQETSLACMLSLPELVRGMDYKFDTIMINAEFAATASQSTLKQAIGRVGRPGSSKATIIFEDMNGARKLIEEYKEETHLKKILTTIKERVPTIIKAHKFTLPTVKIIREKNNTEVIEEVPDNWDD